MITRTSGVQLPAIATVNYPTQQHTHDSMKYFISVDMEGISGIVDSTMVTRTQNDYEQGRKLMTQDVNAAIKGILQVHPDAEITVCDGHGGMNNINLNDLHKQAILIRGTPKHQSQVAGLDDTYDAALFIGYHAKKGTEHAIMSHTYSGRAIEKLTVNNIEIGETGMNAGIAGHHNVPLIFVAGDQATSKEAKTLNPEIETAIVKQAIGRTAAKCLHPEIAHEKITKGVIKALNKTIKPYKYTTPVTIQIRLTDAKKADAASLIPTAKRLDGKTIQFTTQDYIKAFHAFITTVLCASAVS